MASYTVQSGDNLSTIAKKLGLSSYTQLSGYNTADPSLIRPGQVLTYTPPGTSVAPAATPAPAPAPVASAAPASTAPASTAPSTNSLTSAIQSLLQNPNPQTIQQNIQDASVTPETPADIQSFQNQAAAIYDPQKQALSADLEAQLKQTLQQGDAQTANDLSSKGFLRSGQQITQTALQHSVAEADMALQQAGYLSTLNDSENQYAQTLQSQDVATKQANASAALQDQATSMGITQNEFNNMETELNRISSNAQTAFTQGQTVSSAQDSLLTNSTFTSLMMFAQSNPQMMQLLTQMLQNSGFNVTA